MKRLLVTAGGCAAIATTVALVSAGGGGAQTPGGQTITLYEVNKDSYNAFIDNKPVGPVSRKHGPHLSRGDEIAFSLPMVDDGGARKGHLDVHCTVTVPGNFDKGAVVACAGGIRLADGTLTLEAVTPVTSKVTNIAITGGTGAYAGARGTMTSTTLSDTRSKDVITLLG